MGWDVSSILSCVGTQRWTGRGRLRIAATAVAAVLLLSACGGAGEGTPPGSIGGRVIDESGGVARVHISVKPGPPEGIGFVTGDDGTYEVSGVPAGQHRVAPLLDGEVVAPAKVVSVGAGERVNVDFEIE